MKIDEMVNIKKSITTNDLTVTRLPAYIDDWQIAYSFDTYNTILLNGNKCYDLPAICYHTTDNQIGIDAQIEDMLIPLQQPNFFNIDYGALSIIIDDVECYGCRKIIIKNCVAIYCDRFVFSDDSFRINNK
jgi:hypothetical protein